MADYGVPPNPPYVFQMFSSAPGVVACPSATAAAAMRMVDLIEDELNVKAVRFVTDPGELVAVTLKPNFRTLGPRFGKQMPMVAAAALIVVLVIVRPF